MKALKTWMGRPWPPLALALLTALAVHLLALAYGQLAAGRLAAGGQRSPVPPPHDDTPELLEFSRQQPLEETLATVPLPPPSTLPPPPDLLPAAAPPQKAGRNQARTKQRQKSQAPRLAPALKRRSPAPRPPLPPDPSQPGRPALVAATDPPATLALLLEQARRGEVADLLKPEAAAAATYVTLWERARPASALPGAGGPAAQELELRRLPLAEARRHSRAAIPRQHQGVLLGDRLLLLWPEGNQLWLLRVPVANDAASPS